MRIGLMNLWNGTSDFTVCLLPMLAINHDHALTEVALAWLTFSIVIEFNRKEKKQ